MWSVQNDKKNGSDVEKIQVYEFYSKEENYLSLTNLLFISFIYIIDWNSS